MLSADPPDRLTTLKAVLPGYQTGRVLLVVNLSNLPDLPSPLSAGRAANGLQIQWVLAPRWPRSVQREALFEAGRSWAHQTWDCSCSLSGDRCGDCTSQLVSRPSPWWCPTLSVVWAAVCWRCVSVERVPGRPLIPVTTAGQSDLSQLATGHQALGHRGLLPLGHQSPPPPLGGLFGFAKYLARAEYCRSLASADRPSLVQSVQGGLQTACRLATHAVRSSPVQARTQHTPPGLWWSHCSITLQLQSILLSENILTDQPTQGLPS